MKPARTFAWVALVFSGFGLLVATPMVWLVLTEPGLPISQGGGFGASRFVVDNIRVVSSSIWAVAAIGAAAAIGLLRGKRWAYHAWKALLAALILWSLLGVFLELMAVVSSDESLFIDKIFSVATSASALVGAGLLTYLLRKLASPGWQDQLLGR